VLEVFTTGLLIVAIGSVAWVAFSVVVTLFKGQG